jgi:hypothetical protein
MLTHSLVPSQAKEAQQFMKSWGFAKMRTTMDATQCDTSAHWISKLIGLTSGWDDKTTEERLQESNWDIGTHHSGHDRGEFGVIANAKPIEGQSAEVNGLLSKAYRAEPITQAAEIWVSDGIITRYVSHNKRRQEVRARTTECFKPFFGGVDYLHSMPPLLALARETETTKVNNALRCFVPEKRVTKVREDEGGKGRATALQMVNGVFPWVSNSGRSRRRRELTAFRWTRAQTRATSTLWCAQTRGCPRLAAKR